MLLTTLTTHTAAFIAVHWLPDGKFLTSAGDDSIVLLHYLVNQQQSAFGLGTQLLDSWIPRHPLRAHNSDIHDIAWSPDNQRLASASVDNSIIVWSRKSDMPVIKLQGHTGYVKGVAWDPISRFIISQSDDRSVRVWRNHDWKYKKVVTNPAENAVSQPKKNTTTTATNLYSATQATASKQISFVPGGNVNMPRDPLNPQVAMSIPCPLRITQSMEIYYLGISQAQPGPSHNINRIQIP